MAATGGGMASRCGGRLSFQPWPQSNTGNNGRDGLRTRLGAACGPKDATPRAYLRAVEARAVAQRESSEAASSTHVTPHNSAAAMLQTLARSPWQQGRKRADRPPLFRTPVWESPAPHAVPRRAVRSRAPLTTRRVPALHRHGPRQPRQGVLRARTHVGVGPVATGGAAGDGAKSAQAGTVTGDTPAAGASAASRSCAVQGGAPAYKATARPYCAPRELSCRRSCITRPAHGERLASNIRAFYNTSTPIALEHNYFS